MLAAARELTGPPPEPLGAMDSILASLDTAPRLATEVPRSANLPPTDVWALACLILTLVCF